MQLPARTRSSSSQEFVRPQGQHMNQGRISRIIQRRLRMMPRAISAEPVRGRNGLPEAAVPSAITPLSRSGATDRRVRRAQPPTIQPYGQGSAGHQVEGDKPTELLTFVRHAGSPWNALIDVTEAASIHIDGLTGRFIRVPFYPSGVFALRSGAELFLAPRTPAA